MACCYVTDQRRTVAELRADPRQRIGVFRSAALVSKGNFTQFPLINANRPQLVRYDANTGRFSVTTVPIPGSDQFDAIDCATRGNRVIYVTSNNTDLSLRRLRDDGAGFVSLQTVGAGSIETPFPTSVRVSSRAESGRSTPRFSS